MKRFFYFIIPLFLFTQYAQAGEYCIPESVVFDWYKSANAAHSDHNSIEALKYYYALKLVNFGKGSKSGNWPETYKWINDKIAYHERELKISILRTKRTAIKMQMRTQNKKPAEINQKK